MAGVLGRIPQTNFSTKDKPGTLPLNLFESAPAEQHSVDFDVLLNEDISAQQDTSTTHNVVITQSTYVVVSRMYKPRSAPNSPLYITKLLEDVVDDCDSAVLLSELFVTPRMLSIRYYLLLLEKNMSSQKRR